MQTQYITFQISNTVLNVSLSVFLIAYWDIGLEGRLAGIAIAAICFGSWAFFNLKHNNLLDFSFTQENFTAPLRFSVPLVPHSLSSWIKTSVDRILLMSFFGGTVVGEYSVMYQLASILSVVFMAANKALIPYLFTYMKQNSNDLSGATLWCKRIAGGIALASISFFLSVPYIFELVVKGDYSFSSSIVSLLIIGFMLQGFYLLQVNFLMYNEKTKIVAKVAVINAILHLVTAIPMIFYFGAIGAAITNALSWGCLLILMFFYGNKDNAYPWCREV
jgi:Membrane protein involved in the export of O-antigen and teichoic acid